MHVRPREERALTLAIRSVLGGDHTTLCFTAGHGELSSRRAAATARACSWPRRALRDLLDKSNYDLKSVETAAPDAHERLRGCSVVVIAGPQAPFATDEAARLRTWLLEGGSLFATVGPIEGSTDTGMVGAGLDAVLAPFGIALDDDLVHDLDPAARSPTCTAKASSSRRTPIP